MALPEKLYTLRKKSGLSQEQLAEALNVSRQAISKWEGGSAMPESDKLLALSNYFGVSLDYLLKGGAPNAAPAEAQEEHRTMRLLSLILCFGGAAALIVYGVLSILVPSVPAQISGSSMIRIDGSSIFLLLCVAAIAAGAALLLKSTKHKQGGLSMKALSCTFAVLAILLSDVMCAAVAFNYCDMLWGIRYASYSAPASTAFLLVIPYAAAIAVCAALAVIFWRKSAKC